MSRQGLIQGKYRHEDGLWDDMRVSVGETFSIPGPTEPSWLPFINDGGVSEGTYALNFAIGHSAFFHLQAPHGWKEGTLIYPHVHWSTDAGGGPGDVAWELEWVEASPLSPFPPVTTIMPSNPDSVAGPFFHQVIGFPAPIDWSPFTLSTMLLGRIGRIASAAASPPGGPDYPGTIALLEMDFHIQINDMGSTGQWTKG